MMERKCAPGPLKCLLCSLAVILTQLGMGACGSNRTQMKIPFWNLARCWLHSYSPLGQLSCLLTPSICHPGTEMATVPFQTICAVSSCPMTCARLQG